MHYIEKSPYGISLSTLASVETGISPSPNKNKMNQSENATTMFPSLSAIVVIIFIFEIERNHRKIAARIIDA